MSARSNPGKTGKQPRGAAKGASGTGTPGARKAQQRRDGAGKRPAGRRPDRQPNGGAGRARTAGNGPIVFFVALFIVALGAIQLLSTFYTYAIDLSELNGLKRQEAALVAKKQELENDIARWDDKAYVAAQARERLGFVFPGEQVVRVNHPEAVTGDQADADDADGNTTDTGKKTLPWYSELAYSFEQADTRDDEPADGASAQGGADGGASGETSADESADGAADGSAEGTDETDQNSQNTEDQQQ
ncbi:FtsB family cell division protein [Bifidobacterium samirii]|uniref:Septum formation initiator n=1 Tax=Bifidobacterium samirii TaxID=2306974 RepID=A0A430FUR8_9BIFI|nr:septum formation initiator family protein [Bifidobacterium samirii]RSX56984.1 septum formation initiator [Bifidobacterium samirii]